MSAPGLVVELGERDLQRVEGLLIELRDPDIADVAALDVRAHRLHVDDLANDREFLAVLGRRRDDRQPDRGLGGPAHAVDRLLQRQALNRRIVDFDDQVARHHAGARRGRVVDRADDLDEPAFLHHLEAEAAEFLALHRGLEFVERLGIEIVRMRIERGEHAVDRPPRSFSLRRAAST